MRSRKGFALLELVVIGSVLTLLFAGPKLMAGVHNMFVGDKNTSKQLHKVDEKYTIGRLDEKGKFVKMGDYSKNEVMQNIVAEQPPKSFMEIITPWIGLIVVAIIGIPGFGVWLYRKLRGNFSQLVTGVEEAKTQMDAENRAKLENSLSKKMDGQTKKTVIKTKAALVKSGDIKQLAAPINATVTVVK